VQVPKEIEKPQSVVIDMEHVVYGVAVSTPEEVENGDRGYEDTERGGNAQLSPNESSLGHDQNNDQADVAIDIDKLIMSWFTSPPTQS
jgi:hypothetical protein